MKGKTVGQTTTYEPEDELELDLPDEPGYSKDDGCLDALGDLFPALLAILALGLLLARVVMGADLVKAWVCYCHKCQIRATMSVPGLDLAQALAIKWLGQGGWAKSDEGQWLCPKCAKALARKAKA